jgi:hypothetical protein
MPQGINYLAVVVTAVIIFMLGGLWYSPILFAKRWVALQGRTIEEEKAKAAAAGAANYAQVFLCGLVISYVMAVIVVHFANHPLTVFRGAQIGVLVWLIAGATSYGTALFSFKPRALWAIDTGFNLVSLVIAGAILAAWQ